MDTILVPIACFLLLGGFIVAILHPILTRKHAWVRPTDLARSTIELTGQKEQLYSSIRELSFDHSLGKISDVDFETLRIDLEAQALSTLKQLDGLQADKPIVPAVDDVGLDARIEADLQSMTAAPPEAKFCPACGTARPPTHRFCSQCGGAFDTADSA